MTQRFTGQVKLRDMLLTPIRHPSPYGEGHSMWTSINIIIYILLHEWIKQRKTEKNVFAVEQKENLMASRRLV